MVIEVLSASTDLDHHVDKFERYRLCPTLMHYLVFDQKEARAHVWMRDANGWPVVATVVEHVHGMVLRPQIGASISLSGIYRSIGA